MTARKKDMISSLEEVLEKLENVGFYIGDELKENILRLVGER